MSATVLLVEDNPHYLKINREIFQAKATRCWRPIHLPKGANCS